MVAQHGFFTYMNKVSGTFACLLSSGQSTLSKIEPLALSFCNQVVIKQLTINCRSMSRHIILVACMTACHVAVAELGDFATCRCVRFLT